MIEAIVSPRVHYIFHRDPSPSILYYSSPLIIPSTSAFLNPAISRSKRKPKPVQLNTIHTITKSTHQPKKKNFNLKTKIVEKLYILNKNKIKTYNSKPSLMVTHSSTTLPIWSLCMAERTGCPFLSEVYGRMCQVFPYSTIYPDQGSGLCKFRSFHW